MTFEDLVAKVGRERYEAACEWAWRTAEGTGTARRPSEAWPDDLADVPHDIADVWYDKNTTLSARLDLALRVYAEMPCYGNLMYIKHAYEELDGGLKERLWGAFRAALDSDDPRIADPVSYALWVDFFEDQTTVHDAWRQMTRRDQTPWHQRIRRVLENAGPVPWPEKEALFEELVDDAPWHPHILRALVNSAFDVYGQLDIRAARQWLDRLHVSDDAHGLPELRKKLETAD